MYQYMELTVKRLVCDPYCEGINALDIFNVKSVTVHKLNSNVFDRY